MGKVQEKYNSPPVARPSASQHARFARTWGGEIKFGVASKACQEKCKIYGNIQSNTMQNNKRWLNIKQ